MYIIYQECWLCSPVNCLCTCHYLRTDQYCTNVDYLLVFTVDHVTKLSLCEGLKLHLYNNPLKLFIQYIQCSLNDILRKNTDWYYHYFFLKLFWHVVFVDEVELVKTIDGICNKVIFEVRNKQSYELSHKVEVQFSTLKLGE